MLGSLSPEGRLLACCARTQLDDPNAARIRELLRGTLDWPYLHRIAYRNGQMPALDLHLSAIAPGEIPADTAECLRTFAETHRRQNRFLLDLLHELHASFAKQGIAALPYVEAHACFALPGRLDSRGCQWLDFAVRPEETEAARQIIRAQNRWLEQPASEVADSAFPRPVSVVFGNGPRGAALSLHWATAPWVHAVNLDPKEVWERQAATPFGGRMLPALSTEDALLHLCAQNSEYQWSSLAGVSDVAELVRAHPALRWDETLARARRAGVLRSLLLGLHLADELLAAPLPAQVREAARADRGAVALAVEIAAGYFVSAPLTHRTPQTLRFHLRARERVADRLRYLRRFLVTPTAADVKLVRLPAPLRPLYAVLRPLRLVGTAIGLLARRPFRRWWRKPASVSGYSSSGRGVVEAMLALAEVGPDDVVYDLGCGDGRIVIEAARRFGARGVGMDLDPERIRESKENAQRAGVEHRVMFEQCDAMTADFRTATVVAMYLPPRASLELAERLMRELQPGSRIVSHNADLDGWDRVQVCDGDGFPSLLYLRKVPRRQGDSADARRISHSTTGQGGTGRQTT